MLEWAKFKRAQVGDPLNNMKRYVNCDAFLHIWNPMYSNVLMFEKRCLNYFKMIIRHR